MIEEYGDKWFENPKELVLGESLRIWRNELYCF